MYYQFTVAETPACVQTGSNYSDAGLTDYDKLALHILYPEDSLTAEYVGTTVVRVGGTLSLRSAWEARGANMPFVAKNFVWQIDGLTRSTTPDLNVVMGSPGAHTLSLTYDDFLPRHYSTSGTVRVLASAVYNQQIAVPVVATSPLIFRPVSCNLLAAARPIGAQAMRPACRLGTDHQARHRAHPPVAYQLNALLNPGSFPQQRQVESVQETVNDKERITDGVLPRGKNR